MGTKTADETATADTTTDATAQATTDTTADTSAQEKDQTGTTGETGTTDEASATDEAAATDEAGTAADADAGDAEGGKPAPSGVGQGAGAVVSAALGLISLSGSWVGTVAAAREQLIGQLRTSTSASVATQLKEVYGDSWHTTALCGGLFALLALVVGVAVLARPAFGSPGRTQAAWIKSVSWAGVILGVIGLLLAVLKFSDALLALPST
ncbi:hypothetical protein [Streptomyces mexicanus]|uniref:Uncharacterized protein n=1 Tax=Streptomyces mexicanus TaxID=178566 RepID=A0A7X1LS90_9ACTN|nr:hypothetical protein [Streptomyces mexicanus]MBC2867519.1 hypothetical protein [Streptomyces mexicanus]